MLCRQMASLDAVPTAMIKYSTARSSTLIISTVFPHVHNFTNELATYHASSFRFVCASKTVCERVRVF